MAQDTGTSIVLLNVSYMKNLMGQNMRRNYFGQDGLRYHLIVFSFCIPLLFTFLLYWNLFLDLLLQYYLLWWLSLNPDQVDCLLVTVVSVMLRSVTFSMVLAANKRPPVRTNANNWDSLIKTYKARCSNISSSGTGSVTHQCQRKRSVFLEFPFSFLHDVNRTVAIPNNTFHRVTPETKQKRLVETAKTFY